MVRLHEKGGKRDEMPAHHNLEAHIDAYIEAAKIHDAGKAPLFRSGIESFILPVGFLFTAVGQ